MVAFYQSAGRLTAELLNFYGDEEGRTSSGYTLEQILDWPDTEWEFHHDFIQWLFPTDQESKFDADSPVLDAGTIARFRSDPLRQNRLRRSFDRWLHFCGVIRTDTVLAFEHRNPVVWNGPNHNWLRITRVLHSLNLLGLKNQAREFFALLVTVRDTIEPTTWRFWEKASRTG